MVLAVAQSIRKSADAETSSWWKDHDLADADEQIQRAIIDCMFERSPRQMGWAVVTLLGNQCAHLLDGSTIRRVIAWVSDNQSGTRYVRDGVALTFVHAWLKQQPDKAALSLLRELGQSANSGEIRVGLMAAAAYLRSLDRLSHAAGQTALELSKSLARRTDAETANAIGWLLRELLRKDEVRYFRELVGLCPLLSRQAMRTAIERLPREKRTAALADWRRHRASRSSLAHDASRSGGG